MMLAMDVLTSDLAIDGCWSCGETATRPDGLCAPCGAIDPDAVPDIHDPAWKGYAGATDDFIVAPPNAKRVS